MAPKCIVKPGRIATATAIALLACSLGGCQIGYFLLGSGKTKAAYKLPRKTRVLVMVDRAPAGGMPLDAPQQLGREIDNRLYDHRLKVQLVPQYRLTTLRRAERGFSRWSIARVARKVNAAIVIYIYVPKFAVQIDGNHQVTMGYAEAMVKVVNRKGQRLWPAGPTTSEPIRASVPNGLESEQSPAEVQQALIDELSISASRFFYSYKAGHKPGAH